MGNSTPPPSAGELPPRPEQAGYRRKGCPSCDRAQLMDEPACVRHATGPERAWVSAVEAITGETYYGLHWERWLAYQSQTLF